MIVSVLIARSLRTIGALASGESPEASEQADAFEILTTMLDLWRADGLTIYKTERSPFDLVANTQDYTLGPTGDWVFAGAAPVSIPRAAVIEDPSQTTPLETPLDIYTEQEWAGIGLKTMTNTVPSGLRYKRDAPDGTVSVWPIPTSSTPDIVLFLPTPLAAPALVTTDLSTPPGYREALIYNLAIRLAPEFGSKDVDMTDVHRLARESKTIIDRSNPNLERIRHDPAYSSRQGWINPRTGLVE